MTKRKALGYKVPCKPGKSHRVGMITGICSICKKQIHSPDPEFGKRWHGAKLDVVELKQKI